MLNVGMTKMSRKDVLGGHLTESWNLLIHESNPRLNIELWCTTRAWMARRTIFNCPQHLFERQVQKSNAKQASTHANSQPHDKQMQAVMQMQGTAQTVTMPHEACRTREMADSWKTDEQHKSAWSAKLHVV